MSGEGSQSVAQELEERIAALEATLGPFLESGADGELGDEEVARLNIVLAYAMSSLFFMFLRTQGIATAGHPVKKELARIQGYMAKLKTASETARQKKSNEEAAERLIESVAESGEGKKKKREEEERMQSKHEDDDEDRKKKKKKKKSKKEKKERA